MPREQFECQILIVLSISLVTVELCFDKLRNTNNFSHFFHLNSYIYYHQIWLFRHIGYSFYNFSLSLFYLSVSVYFCNIFQNLFIYVISFSISLSMLYLSISVYQRYIFQFQLIYVVSFNFCLCTLYLQFLFICVMSVNILFVDMMLAVHRIC